MSNPLNSLNRYPKRPFRENNLNKINEKFLHTSVNLDESGLQNFETPLLDLELKELLDDVSTDIAKNNVSKYSREMIKSEFLPAASCYSSRSNDSTIYKPLTEDYEIISKLMKKIKQMELAHRYQEKEIKEKNLRIKILEDKCKLYQKSKEINNVNYDRVRELEKNCEKLQTQVSEMENFLADYGLVWVGEESVTDDELIQNNMWNVEESSSTFREEPISGKFVVDYDKILLNIEELNQLVKSEESQVTLTGPQRVELKKKECIRLTLYANGISLFNGPFRSFSNKSTRDVIQDIIDGYFPSELEERYPSGVPFQVIDRRNIYFDIKQIDIFQGPGKILGGQSTSSKLVDSNALSSRVDNQYTQPYTDVLSNDPSTHITVEQFLRKLPTSTINKNGKIIAIRNSIQEIIENKPMEKISITSSEQQEQRFHTSPLDVSNNAVPIKFRTVCGKHVHCIFMKPTQTVGEIYQKISEITNMNVSEFVLISAFPPNDKFVDMSVSLQSCGLTTSSSLCMKRLMAE